MSGKTPLDDARETYKKRDMAHWKELETLIEENKLPLSEVLINFPAFVRRRELTRLLADYDLFKLIVDLPGSIAELGVYLGSGIFTWAKLLETFTPGDRSRMVYGFESTLGYRSLSAEDGKPQPWIDSVTGPKVVSKDYLDRMVRLTNLDGMIPGIERVRVITGDIAETVPAFARDSQGIRLSLLYLDVNLFAPTLVGLRALYPLLIPGGVLAFNGYAAPPWQGETLAIGTYFNEIGAKQPTLRKYSYSTHPSGYLIKE